MLVEWDENYHRKKYYLRCTKKLYKQRDKIAYTNDIGLSIPHHESKYQAPLSFRQTVGIQYLGYQNRCDSFCFQGFGFWGQRSGWRSIEMNTWYFELLWSIWMKYGQQRGTAPIAWRAPLKKIWVLKGRAKKSISGRKNFYHTDTRNSVRYRCTCDHIIRSDLRNGGELE